MTAAKEVPKIPKATATLFLLGNCLQSTAALGMLCSVDPHYAGPDNVSIGGWSCSPSQTLMTLHGLNYLQSASREGQQVNCSMQPSSHHVGASDAAEVARGIVHIIGCANATTPEYPDAGCCRTSAASVQMQIPFQYPLMILAIYKIMRLCEHAFG